MFDRRHNDYAYKNVTRCINLVNSPPSGATFIIHQGSPACGAILIYSKKDLESDYGIMPQLNCQVGYRRMQGTIILGMCNKKKHII